MTYKKNSKQTSFFFSALLHLAALLILMNSAAVVYTSSSAGHGVSSRITFSIGNITVSPLTAGKSALTDHGTASTPAEQMSSGQYPAQAVPEPQTMSAGREKAALADKTGERPGKTDRKETGYERQGDAGNSSVTSGHPGEASLYITEVRRKIQASSYYPLQAKALGMEGQVIMAFHVDLQGYVRDLTIISPARHDILNRAAARIIENSSPLPLPPRDFDYLIRVPVTFRIKDS